MAQLWVTGPAHFFCRFPSGSLGSVGPALYLGTCEQAPEIAINEEWEPVFNDISGTRVPFDKMHMGEWGMTLGILNRWNEATVALIQSRPNVNSVQGRGVNVAGDRGTLMITEGLAWELFVQFPYATKGAMAGMVNGYHFFASWLRSPDRMQIGTRNRSIACLFEHFAPFQSVAGAFPAQSFPLYNFDLSGIVGVQVT